jgi:methyl-accepting chemotaxis protein WspA
MKNWTNEIATTTAEIGATSRGIALVTEAMQLQATGAEQISHALAQLTEAAQQSGENWQG